MPIRLVHKDENGKRTWERDEYGNVATFCSIELLWDWAAETYPAEFACNGLEVYSLPPMWIEEEFAEILESSTLASYSKQLQEIDIPDQGCTSSKEVCDVKSLTEERDEKDTSDPELNQPVGSLLKRWTYRNSGKSLDEVKYG